MRKLMFTAAALLLAAIPAYAQRDYPKGEVYGGYSYFTADVNTNNPFSRRERIGFHGFGFSGAANFTDNLGVVADFSYHKKNLTGTGLDFSIFNFLFGPRFTVRGDRVEGFAHALVGGIRRRVETFSPDTDFALGAGGGMDVKVSRDFAIRVFQLDYIPFRDRNPFTGVVDWRHNLRVGVGATFRLH
ncbi:MAG TPA: outer membrane beta-barrel protein [Blastocatellia bacterium]|nr:outer membrane beta-barrel protein [Blastocatellia bacterium]